MFWQANADTVLLGEQRHVINPITHEPEDGA
jgi:hypothetical protein